MLLLTISLYEFGQFLRIILWISLPMVVIAMLITTYLHYRKKVKMTDDLVLSVDGYEPPENVEGLTTGRMSRVQSSAPTDAGTGNTAERVQQNDEDNENMYRGILWMKEKFEQYRDLADQRYDQLKEQLAQETSLHNDQLEKKDQLIRELQAQLEAQGNSL